MASISTDSSGNRRVFFTASDGKRTAIYLGKLPKKATREIATKIQSLAVAKLSHTSIDDEVAIWLVSIDAVLYDKLAAHGLVPKRARAEKATLATFIDGYIKDRSDVQGATATVYGHTRRCLVNYFGPDKPLAEITPGDADAWRRYLARPKPKGKLDQNGEGLSENTIRRRCAIAKQFFQAALDGVLIVNNPFAKMKKLSVRGNKAKEFYVTREMAQRVLDACPDAEWRMIFSLSRFGGLRCPSEHLKLRWGDIDWDRGRITIHSPKTAHHDGKDRRVIPLFPELRPYLDALWDRPEAERSQYVITRYREQNQNLRTQLLRIIANAGLAPWPKLFQNLRSTRQTELAEQYPGHVVCAWIGNSQAVAREHYLQVTEDHFTEATQNPTQSASVLDSSDSHGAEPKQKNPDETVVSRGIVPWGMGGTGLEPVTSTV